MTLNIYGGDWWEANQMMDCALSFTGYEHKSEWDDSRNDGKHGTALSPAAMRLENGKWIFPIRPFAPRDG